MEVVEFRGRPFTARGFILATIIGGILGGTILLSANFYYMRRYRLALITWVLSLVLIAAHYLLTFYLAQGAIPITIFFVLLSGMWTINKFQRDQIDLYVAEGNTVRPAWLGAVVGILSFFLMAALARLMVI